MPFVWATLSCSHANIFCIHYANDNERIWEDHSSSIGRATYKRRFQRVFHWGGGHNRKAMGEREGQHGSNRKWGTLDGA